MGCLDELVDVLDSRGEGRLEVVERALDDGAVSILGVALSLGGFHVVFARGNGFGVTSAGRAGPATAGEVALDARVLLDVPVLRALGPLGLGLGLTLDGLVEGLVGGQDGVALATLCETFIDEDVGVVLGGEVETTLHLAAGGTGEAAVAELELCLSVSIAAELGASRALEATETNPDLCLGFGVSITLEDGVDGGGELVLDGLQGRAGLGAGHALEATETNPQPLGLGECESVGNGLGCALGLGTGRAWESTETQLELGVGGWLRRGIATAGRAWEATASQPELGVGLRLSDGLCNWLGRGITAAGDTWESAATQSELRVGLRLGDGLGERNWLRCGIAAAGDTREATATQSELRVGLSIGSGKRAGRQGEGGEDGGSDLHVDGTLVVVVDFVLGLVLAERRSSSLMTDWSGSKNDLGVSGRGK